MRDLDRTVEETVCQIGLALTGISLVVTAAANHRFAAMLGLASFLWTFAALGAVVWRRP